MKLIHIIDSATDIPALFFRLGEAVKDDRVAQAILARAGFGRDQEAHDSYLVLVHLEGPFAAHVDPFMWPNATMTAAHLWLTEHDGEISHGGVLDAEPLRLRLVGAA